MRSIYIDRYTKQEFISFADTEIACWLEKFGVYLGKISMKISLIKMLYGGSRILMCLIKTFQKF